MGYTPPASIIIGSEAIEGIATWGANFAYINEGASADGSGKITSVEIWATQVMTGCMVATFFVVSGNNLSTRDYQTVDNGNGAGVVLGGSKQTFIVDLDVVEGDYIGIYFATGKIGLITTGGGGVWYAAEAGNNIPYEDATFTHLADYAFSLYGTGSTGAGELTIGEAFSIVDSKVTKIVKALAEAFSIADSKVTKIVKALPEAFSIVDSKVTKIVKALPEAFSIVDSLLHRILLSEALSIADSLVKNAIKQLTEAFSVADSFVKNVVKQLAEAFSVADSFKRFFYNLYSKISKYIATYTKRNKDTSTYTKVDKEESEYIKKDKDRGEEL